MQQLLKRLADRVLPPTYRHPEPPVESAKWAPSWMFSADDDVQPTQRLLKLALDAAEAAVDLDLGTLAGGTGVPDSINAFPGEPYRFLAGLMRVMRPRVVVHVGPRDVCALVLEKSLGEAARFIAINPATERVNVQAIQDASLIHVAAAPEGALGHPYFDGLRDVRWNNHPVAVFDGTRRWNMLGFWRDLPHPKLDVTSFASWDGSGIAEL